MSLFNQLIYEKLKEYKNYEYLKKNDFFLLKNYIIIKEEEIIGNNNLYNLDDIHIILKEPIKNL